MTARRREGEKETVRVSEILDAVARDDDDDDMASGAYHLELGVGVDVSFKEWFRRASSSSGQVVVGGTWQGRRGMPSIS